MLLTMPNFLMSVRTRMLVYPLRSSHCLGIVLPMSFGSIDYLLFETGRSFEMGDNIDKTPCLIKN
jgi:hypothetical protein